MSDIDSEIEEAAFRAATQYRHAQAIHTSDVLALRQALLAASERFADLADLIEKDHPDCRHINFMRASAKRYRRESGLP